MFDFNEVQLNCFSLSGTVLFIKSSFIYKVIYYKVIYPTHSHLDFIPCYHLEVL